MKPEKIADWPPEVRESLLARTSEIIEAAFQEDVDGAGDVTSRAIFPPDTRGNARIFAKADGVVAGLFIAEAVFQFMKEPVKMDFFVRDGQPVSSGDTLLTVAGPVRVLLEAERTALNFLGRLSGIATLTRRFVDAVSGTRAKILDTRKTTPGWRLLEKYAVRQGGGTNHRLGLFDMVLIKDNHIQAAGGIKPAVEQTRRYFTEKGLRLPIEVEVKNLDELQDVLHLQVDRVMLDNMDAPTLREAVQLAGGRVPLEASGGVTLTTVRTIAETGVDFISVGALTHSAPVLDLSMLME